MKPKGGKSHLTPITHRWRLFTSGGSAGSLGSFGLAAVPAGPLLPEDAAPLHAATAAAATATAAVAITSRLIQPLLVRRWSTPRASGRAEACGGGTAASSPPSADRAGRPAR